MKKPWDLGVTSEKEEIHTPGYHLQLYSYLWVLFCSFSCFCLSGLIICLFFMSFSIAASENYMPTFSSCCSGWFSAPVHGMHAVLYFFLFIIYIFFNAYCFSSIHLEWWCIKLFSVLGFTELLLFRNVIHIPSVTTLAHLLDI